MTPKTIGVLTTGYPRHERDVAGIFVRGMSKALAARGHRIEVLAPAPRSAPRSPARDDEGISVRWLSYGPAPLRSTFYGSGVPDNVRDPRAWPGLATYPLALLREARRAAPRWDAVVSHWALPSALVAGRVRGAKPHLAVLHSADVHLLRSLPRPASWARAVARSASQLLFASSALRERMLATLAPLERATVGGRSHACAMGIEPAPEVEGRRALRERLGLRRFTVLSLGRLVPIKGIDRVLSAMLAVPDAELLVVGDGPERARLERLADKLGVRVRFLGERTGLDKAELLAASDAFVLPSRALRSGRTEGSPTVLLEAAQARLAIVATSTGGVPEIFEHERSALLTAGDPGSLGRALARLRADRNLRRRLARAAGRIADRYLWSELGPRIETLLLS